MGFGVMNWLNLALRVKDAEIRYHKGVGSPDEFRQALGALKEEVDGELFGLDDPQAWAEAANRQVGEADAEDSST